MQEKVDLKERVEELEHRCIQLSGETDTIGEWGGRARGGGGGLDAGSATSHLSPSALLASRRRVYRPLSESEGGAEGPASGEGGIH